MSVSYYKEGMITLPVSSYKGRMGFLPVSHNQGCIAFLSRSITLREEIHPSTPTPSIMPFTRQLHSPVLARMRVAWTNLGCRAVLWVTEALIHQCHGLINHPHAGNHRLSFPW